MLIMRTASSIIYTHNFIYLIESHDTKLAIDWVFYVLSINGALLSMLSGIIFLLFSFILHQAHTRQSLFGSGLLVEEQDMEP
jgi:hypothetical protein